MKKPSISVKIGVIALIITFTLLYALYSKKSIDSLLTDANDLILKDLPTFSAKVFPDKTQTINDRDFLTKPNRLGFVHFWATWCGPCEAELPDFLNLVEQYKDSGVKALLIAVQDDEEKMSKYLKRFKTLPSNIVVIHDQSGEIMSRFGTVKIPETYLFGSNFKNLNKYVGPQDWALKRYKDRLDFYLSSLSDNDVSQNEYTIETH